MAAGQSGRWSIWKAALWGCALSALLLVRHLTGDVGPIPSQTVAGQIGYWAGYLGVPPFLFVMVAVIRNALTPRATSPEAPHAANDQPAGGGIANFFWPNRIKPEPRGVARFGRVLHWLFAAGALAFVLTGLYAMLTYGNVTDSLALIFFGGGFCFFTGRALRYVFAGE